MVTPSDTPSGTEEADPMAAAAELLWAAVVGVVISTEVLGDCPCDFFLGGGADVSPELFLFDLFATSAPELDVMMSDNLVTAQETNIIICHSRGKRKAMKEKLQGFSSLVEIGRAHV